MSKPRRLHAAEPEIQQRPAVSWDKLILREPDAVALIGSDKRQLQDLVRLRGVRRKLYPDGEYRYYAHDLLGLCGPIKQNLFDLLLSAMKDGDGKDVYFVQPLEGGPIKIGSSSNLKKRLADFQCASPVKLSLLFVWRRGGTAGEKALHHTLLLHRSHGEWFYDRPEVRSCIEHVKRLPEACPSALTAGK